MAATRLCLGVALTLVLGLGATSFADDSFRSSLDVLVYSDNDGVSVVSPQLSVQQEIDDDGGKVSAHIVVDQISAASADVISQATSGFTETRFEADLAVSKSILDHLTSISYRVSDEPDYLSHGGHLGIEHKFTADATLSIGYGLTRDRITMTGTSPSVFSEKLSIHTADLSFTQVLSRNSLLRVAYTMTYQSGYMEKVYRFVPLFEEASMNQLNADGMQLSASNFNQYRLAAKPPEEVPDTRSRHALGIRGLRYFSSLNASLKLDYQLYGDSWGVLANMIDLNIAKQFNDQWRGDVFFRVYDQGAASFWKRSYVVSGPNAVPTFRTADRNLSKYTSTSSGLRVEWSYGKVELYAEGTAMWTDFQNFLYLDNRLALIGMTGARWTP